MKAVTAHIVFPDRGVSIRRVSSVMIEQAWQQLTGKAEITLPRNVPDFEKRRVREVFRRGDRVEIYLGYNGQNTLEFSGYVVSVSADIPISIRCEDEAYKVKPIAVNYSSADTGLKEMLQAIVPGYSIRANEGIRLGGVRWSRTNVGAVLDKLASDWGIYSHLDANTLVSGVYYDTESPVLQIDLEKDGVSNELNYRNREDILVKVQARSILVNGEVLELSVGEDGGDLLKLDYYNITVRAELERLARADYERRKRGGFDGTLTVFAIPGLKHGRRIHLVSTVYPDRNGDYHVDAIKKTLDTGGYRNEIKLGERI